MVSCHTHNRCQTVKTRLSSCQSFNQSPSLVLITFFFHCHCPVSLFKCEVSCLLFLNSAPTTVEQPPPPKIHSPSPSSLKPIKPKPHVFLPSRIPNRLSRRRRWRCHTAARADEGHEVQTLEGRPVGIRSLDPLASCGHVSVSGSVGSDTRVGVEEKTPGSPNHAMGLEELRHHGWGIHGVNDGKWHVIYIISICVCTLYCTCI